MFMILNKIDFKWDVPWASAGQKYKYSLLILM